MNATQTTAHQDVHKSQTRKSMYQIKQDLLQSTRKKAISMGIKNATELRKGLANTAKYDRNILSQVKISRGRSYTQFREEIKDKQRKASLRAEMHQSEQTSSAAPKYKSVLEKLKEQKQQEEFVNTMKLMADPKTYTTRRATGTLQTKLNQTQVVIA